jgi:hypothetical protein
MSMTCKSEDFGHSGGWARRMIPWHLNSTNSENPTANGRLNAIDSDKEKKPIQFCLVRQSEKNLVTVQDAIDFLHDNRVQVDRFWIRRFVERNSQRLTLQQTGLWGKRRHKILEDDLNCYFDAGTIQENMYRHCSSGVQMKPESESQRSMSPHTSLF